MTEADFPAEPRSCNCAALRKATRRVSRLYDRCLAPSGLTSGQFVILTELARREDGAEPSQTELARTLVMDRAGLAHTLRPLVRDGLVELAPDPRDGRASRVRLTEWGSARIRDAYPLWREAQARFEAVFGEDQAIALRALLRVVGESDALADDP